MQLLSETLPDETDAPESRDEAYCEALYLRAFPDVAYAVSRGRFASGHDHYVACGRQEILDGRRPNVFASDEPMAAEPAEQFLFDEIGHAFFEELYLELNADVAAAVRAGMIPSGQAHWSSSGWYEYANGARPLINFVPPARSFSDYAGDPGAGAGVFDETLYRLLYPDVAPILQANDAGRHHWQNHGRFEARIGPGLNRKRRRVTDLRALAQRPLGFNIYGAFSTESGLGTAARSLAKAVRFAGFEVDLWCFSLVGGELRPASHHAGRRPRFSINLMLANADQLMRLFAAYPEGHFDDAYNIAVWQWELAAFRPDWFYEFEGLNEVWTNSAFQARAIGSIAPVPVRNVHLPVEACDLSRDEFCDEFGIPRDRFTFFLSFDVGSTLLRKNPGLAIEAFIALHERFPHTHLVIKFHGSANDPSTLRLLLRQIAGNPNITVIGARLNHIEFAKLRASCDCLVSSHRSEGYGLQVAEFMARGKAVIATAYSGVCDFFDAGVGYPIAYDLVELDESAGPYRKGSIWAEPRLDSLLEQMERLLTDPEDAASRRLRAKERMASLFSLEAIGADIRRIVDGLELNAAVPDYLAGLRIPDRQLDPLAFRRSVTARPGGGPGERIVFSIVVPVYNVPGRFLRQCVESVFAQTYADWELCICNDASTRPDTLAELDRLRGVSPFIKIVDHETNRGISGATNSAIHMAVGRFVVLLDNDDVVMPNALEEVAKAIQANATADVLYTDEIKIDENDAVIDHFYKPDWSPEHLESVMYVLHMLVIRKSLLLKVDGCRSDFVGAQDYDLMLRLSRETQNIAHIPLALYKWRAIPGSAAASVDAKPDALVNGFRALQNHVGVKYGPDAAVEPGLLQGTFRVRRPLRGDDTASLLILTANAHGTVPERGEISYVENFVDSIIEKTSYKNYEIVVVDDAKLSIDQVRLFEKRGVKIVNFYKGSNSFNYAEKANFAIRQARTEHIVLLNDDMEVIRGDWLESLIELSSDAGIGAVGARLLHADRTVQHVGMVLGVLGGATHVYHSYPEDFVGYNGFTHLIRNFSSVTAACLATRRSIMSAIGGFDERFAIDYNDVDLCLRLIRAGYRIAYTPYAELYHFESATAKRTAANPGDASLFAANWRDLIARDPYYNVNLSRNAGDYSLRT